MCSEIHKRRMQDMLGSLMRDLGEMGPEVGGNVAQGLKLSADDTIADSLNLTLGTIFKITN